MTKKERIAGVLTLFFLGLFINPTDLSAQNQPAAKGKTGFVLTIQDNLLSLKATDASLIEVLEEVGRRMKIEVVAALPEKEKITAEFNKLSLEDAIKRLTPNYSHAMISEPGGKKISKIIVLQKGGETARPVPAAKAPKIKRSETVARPAPSVKQEIVKEKAPVVPQPSFKFEFDPSQFEKRK
jgi:hypothetical protein